MRRDQLDAETETNLEEFLRTLAEDLNRSSSPHLSAATCAWIEDGTSVLSGGMLRAPSKPPFHIQDRVLTMRHRKVLESGDGSLYALVVRASRHDTTSPWQLEPVIVSRSEYRALAAARRSIDLQVESRLREMVVGAGAWESLSFERRGTSSTPKTNVFIRTPSKLEKLSPSLELLKQLEGTIALYKQAGLNLLDVRWTIQNHDVMFTDYFE